MSRAVRDRYRIVRNEPIADGIFELILDAQDIAAAATPGQFVNLYLPDGAMLLPRPISIAGADAGTGEVSLIYAVVGAGTQALSALRPSPSFITTPASASVPPPAQASGIDFDANTIKAMGPLGTGFFDYKGSLLASVDLPVESSRKQDKARPDAQGKPSALLVGGGVGVPPLLFAAQRLRENYSSNIEITAFLGYRNAPWLDERFVQICDVVHTISETLEDLSEGSPVVGNVIDLLVDAWRDEIVTIQREPSPMCPTLALSCGPKPMLAAVCAWCAQNGIALRVSLEERMGCGYGACAGCTAKTRPLNDPAKPQNGPESAGEDGIIKKKVCVHGPVFWADEVLW